MQNHAGVCALDGPTTVKVELPPSVAHVLLQFQGERHSGHVTLHFKEGRIMQTEGTVIVREGGTATR